MPQTAPEILGAARQLPRHQQLWIGQELLEDEVTETQEEIEAAWGDEIKRRLDEIDSGAIQIIPGEVAVERMFARISAARSKK